MNQTDIGLLIRSLRTDKCMTQKQIADRLGVSDKAVSKWERGLGLPDVSLLSELAHLLDVGTDTLLCGRIESNSQTGGNMKKLSFYVCPECGNVLTSLNGAQQNCCGKILSPLLAEKATDSEKLSVERLDNELYISSAHPMAKEHYISFAAIVSGDKLLFYKLYPEWGLSLRTPDVRFGQLYWYCTQHGLFCQVIK